MQHPSGKLAKKICQEEKINGLALSVTYGDSSPKGRALGKTENLTVLPKPLTLTDSPGRGRWHEVPEGDKVAMRKH